MPSELAPITPAVMRWARITAKYSIEEAAAKLGRLENELIAWEDGADEPTVVQARNAAKLYRRSFAVLFLPEPPADFSVIPDYRKLPLTGIRAYSRELTFLLRETHERLAWAGEFLTAEEHAPLDFVGSATIKDAPGNVAEAIRQRLGVGTDDTARCADTESALRMWIAKAEDAGVFVFRTGTVESAEACGFVLSDTLSPFIYLNSNDAKARQLFTLAHELVHLWVNQSAVSNMAHSGHAPNRQIEQTETFCNKVAALLLLDPARLTIERAKLPPDMNVVEAADRLAKKFKVSGEVVARQLLDKGEIRDEDYEQVRVHYISLWRQHREREKAERERLKQEGRPSPPLFYQLKPVQCGYSFMRTVLTAYSSGSATATDVQALLGVSVKTIPKFSEIVGLPLPAMRAGG